MRWIWQLMLDCLCVCICFSLQLIVVSFNNLLIIFVLLFFILASINLLPVRFLYTACPYPRDVALH